MEEKKFTDEATIDSLKEMAIKLSKDSYACRVLANAIDLIHRLQSEVQRLAKLEMEHIGVIADQKLEIERLTEKVENQKAVIKGQNKAIEKEKSENKRLYDEYVRLDDFCAGKGCLCCICECKKTCNECAKCGSLKTEKCTGFRIDVSKYARAIERADKLHKREKANGYEVKNGKLYYYSNMLEGCEIEFKDLQEICDGLNHYNEEFWRLDQRLAFWQGKAEETRKETVEKFAERLKASLDISVEGYSTSEVMSEIEDSIDEICKEITEGK